MSNEKFTWKLKSTVTIVALGRTVNNLNLDKDLEVLGTLSLTPVATPI